MVSSDGMAGPDVLQLWSILNDMPVVLYQQGELSCFWRVWGNNYEDFLGVCCLREPVEEGALGEEESFGDVVSDDF